MLIPRHSEVYAREGNGMKKISFTKILLQQMQCFCRDSFGTEFREFFKLYFCFTERNSELFSLPRNGSVDRNKILSACFYFCSTEWKKLFSLPCNSSEWNSESLLPFLFHGTEYRAFFSSAERFGTEFREFSVPRNSARTHQLFRLFRLPRNHFLSEIVNPNYGGANQSYLFFLYN